MKNTYDESYFVAKGSTEPFKVRSRVSKLSLPTSPVLNRLYWPNRKSMSQRANVYFHPCRLISEIWELNLYPPLSLSIRRYMHLMVSQNWLLMVTIYSISWVHPSGASEATIRRGATPASTTSVCEGDEHADLNNPASIWSDASQGPGYAK